MAADLRALAVIAATRGRFVAVGLVIGQLVLMGMLAAGVRPGLPGTRVAAASYVYDTPAQIVPAAHVASVGATAGTTANPNTRTGAAAARPTPPNPPRWSTSSISDRRAAKGGTRSLDAILDV